MNLSRIFLGVAVSAASVVGQSDDPALRQPGGRLVLVPSEPLIEPRFPRMKTDKEKPAPPLVVPSVEQGVRPAILDLRPAGDPIFLAEDREPEAGHNQWRTYTRPKVEPFSRDGEGVGLQGYDVVSYLGGRAERGTQGFSVRHGGTIWQFATAENGDLFSKNPERYLPAYGGSCAYSVGKGYPATADPRVFTIVGGRLYLFFDKAVQAVWEQDQDRLVRKADNNWPKLHR